jgi:hypothetical protein
MSAANQRTRELIRPRPKRSTPRNVDSRKKARIPSAASGAPKMSPTNVENCAQLVPNWNSITSPEATPTTKVRAKKRVQKAAARS